MTRPGPVASDRRVDLYDTTLRDGTQGEDVAFSVEDKLRIARRLDDLGLSYIEGGWPGSNPRDAGFFEAARSLRLRHAKLAAFGMTRRAKSRPSEDPNLRSIVKSGTPVATIFGKSWLLHVRDALRVSPEENLDLIHSSIAFLRPRFDEVFYDAEHFFDGWKSDPEYALRSVEAAAQAGAAAIVLCDTNGGSLPDEIRRAIREVRSRVRTPLGIHTHNDGELAVANALTAVAEGAVQVQGTINGMGERCGNANLCSILPNLQIKFGIRCVSDEGLKHLREVSRFVDELANFPHNRRAAFVGESAFAHKGGVHVSAVLRNPRTYEHVDPATVGNRRRILVSDLSGEATILDQARRRGLGLDRGPASRKVLERLKELEHQGYQFEGAEGSFEILLHKALDRHRSFFDLKGFRVTVEKLKADEPAICEATIQVEVGGHVEHTAASGNGPVNALDNALRKALERFYPELRSVELRDFKVRVLSTGEGTGSSVRVLIESSDGKNVWGTVGVSPNIIEASWQALVDSIEYRLMQGKGARPSPPPRRGSPGR